MIKTFCEVLLASFAPFGQLFLFFLNFILKTLLNPVLHNLDELMGILVKLLKHIIVVAHV